MKATFLYDLEMCESNELIKKMETTPCHPKHSKLLLLLPQQSHKETQAAIGHSQTFQANKEL